MFDLDDTVFDYKHARLAALEAMRGLNATLSRVPLAILEREHEVLLQADYMKVLDKVLTFTDSRLRRTRILFENHGVALSPGEVLACTEVYQSAYEKNLRAVPHVKDLIQAVKKTFTAGIVSNGACGAQMEKLKICRVDGLFDYLVFSEDVGVRKPDRAIFETALSKSGCKPEDAVFIGDSWEADITGAANCGIATIWLNRYGKAAPKAGLTREIHSFDDIPGILGLL